MTAPTFLRAQPETPTNRDLLSIQLEHRAVRLEVLIAELKAENAHMALLAQATERDIERLRALDAKCNISPFQPMSPPKLNG